MIALHLSLNTANLRQGSHIPQVFHRVWLGSYSLPNPRETRPTKPQKFLHHCKYSGTYFQPLATASVYNVNPSSLQQQQPVLCEAESEPLNITWISSNWWISLDEQWSSFPIISPSELLSVVPDYRCTKRICDKSTSRMMVLNTLMSVPRTHILRTTWLHYHKKWLIRLQ